MLRKDNAGTKLSFNNLTIIREYNLAYHLARALFLVKVLIEVPELDSLFLDRHKLTPWFEVLTYKEVFYFVI
jgi:hypothetical protein